MSTGGNRQHSALVHRGPAHGTFEHLGVGSQQVNLVLECANSVSVPSSTALRNVDKVHHKTCTFPMLQCCGTGNCEVPPGACEAVSEF